MSSTHLPVTDALAAYIRASSQPEPELLQRLRAETALDPLAIMQISPDQGAFLSLLVRLINARRTLEVGVFTGYSSTCVAMALPAEGRIIACDVSEQWTSIARKYWREAGVENKIDLRLAPALETLDALIAEGQSGTFDFAFIDADKQNYSNYFDRALELLRPGGLIAVDNVLWHGRVLDLADQDPETEGIRAFNRKAALDPRVHLSMVPIGDGVTLALKK
ncbi:MAG: class I SAM-dependent methyltransferase [Bryobacteraceae bacterium]